MESKEVFREMVQRSGKSQYRISKDMGLSANWLNTTISKGQPQKVPTFVRVAHECGFVVVARNVATGEEMEITE